MIVHQLGALTIGRTFIVEGQQHAKKKMVEQYQAQITTLEGNLVEKSL
jgi:hypothetical protein